MNSSPVPTSSTSTVATKRRRARFVRGGAAASGAADGVVELVASVDASDDASDDACFFDGFARALVCFGLELTGAAYAGVALGSPFHGRARHRARS